jgi:hypothetical protein
VVVTKKPDMNGSNIIPPYKPPQFFEKMPSMFIGKRHHSRTTILESPTDLVRHDLCEDNYDFATAFNELTTEPKVKFLHRSPNMWR